MTAAFQKATGIPVKLDDNSTGPLLTQIEASAGLRLEPGGRHVFSAPADDGADPDPPPTAPAAIAASAAADAAPGAGASSLNRR
jgi:hypothetical protein